MQIAIAQKNFIVGDVDGNSQKILQLLDSACEDNIDILVFPELTISGYPPEDLLLKPEFYRKIEHAVNSIIKATTDSKAALVIGYPVAEKGEYFNALSMISAGSILATHYKQALPNYSVFDEQRYFSAGNSPTLVSFQGKNIALQICEDIWQSAPMNELEKHAPDLLIVANASPFHLGHYQQRNKIIRSRCQQLNCPIVYANLIGGQDELVFDGASMVFDASGKKVAEWPQFEEYFGTVNWQQKFEVSDPKLTPRLKSKQAKISDSENAESLQKSLPQLYQALVLGVKDYVHKNGFSSAVIGLSGGIDSALTLAVAVDALGAENVTAIMMPFKYTSTMSLEDAQQQAKTLGVQYEVISIAPIYQQFMQQLAPLFIDTKPDTTEENLQARCRGVLLMAYSNKFGSIVLTTGNKSEMAVGYATLYGDMAGGFAVLKDVFKNLVYALARYRNQQQVVIPERVITRPPSAELAPDQVDQDSLPPYDELDAILSAYIEQEKGVNEIVALGFNASTVSRVINLVDINEHKRRQAPPGVRVTSRAFGRDHRYPITSAYRKQPPLKK